MFQCPDCLSSFSRLISLSVHYRLTHKKPAKMLYIALNCNGIEPTCKCGCGSSVKYLGIEAGFREYLRGHISRVKNNWGHNKEAGRKSQETRRSMILDGTWKPFVSNETGEHWGKGLTKETDIRIAHMSESIKNNPEEVKRRSVRMKANRLSGKIPTLFGPEHSQWKGGVSSLRDITYSRLYAEWKLPKLEKAGFKCSLCGGVTNLEVHHDKETLSTILNHLATVNNWDTATWKVDPKWINDPKYQELKISIADAVSKYHIQNNVSGIVLCGLCHKEQHNKIDSVK